jgi:isoprenylcysteine carboxyl methyltransferase (ICMT) family protein YpbQ
MVVRRNVRRKRCILVALHLGLESHHALTSCDNRSQYEEVGHRNISFNVSVHRGGLLGRVHRPSRPSRDCGCTGILWLAASFVFAIGWGLMTWCCVVNPFLEKTVRIQTDNEHCVVQTGPYAFVRHPFYVGNIAVMLATPVMLASIWTHIPCIALVVVLFVRTALEDRTLQAELPGYREYAERVRYRLIPGVF